MTSDEVNALPERVRLYIHDLETRCDPAGEVRAYWAQRENAAALALRVHELERELADVAYFDQAARVNGTRLDIPVELPGIDEDHIHFVLMPIGAVSRRAAVEWLKSQGTPMQHEDAPQKPEGEAEIRTCAECGENDAADGFSWCDECRQRPQGCG